VYAYRSMSLYLLKVLIKINKPPRRFALCRLDADDILGRSSWVKWAITMLAVITCMRLKHKKGEGSPYSITERRVSELIPFLGSQPADDVSHKPCGRLPLLSARPAVTPATLKRAATNFAAW